MKEIWKNIPEYEGVYQASNLGRVRSLKFNKCKILKNINYGPRYLAVSLNSKKFYIHQIMAMTFLNHKTNGFKIVVDHIDNNPLNNNLDNLQIITHRQNVYKDKKCSSKYTGVCFHKVSKKFMSYISINNKKKYLGLFNNEKIAHAFYLYNVDLCLN